MSTDTTPHADDERLLAGRYRFRARLGAGGMGTVWRAHDGHLGRDVAVKEVRFLGLGAHEASVLQSRLRQEARAAARVDDPGVITVYDVLEEDGRPWIVMELIDGRSLGEAIAQDGPLGWQEAARLGSDLLRTLRRAHEAGVIHRDVKPANVLLQRGGRTVLTDFGIAVLDDAAGLTRSGDLVGSPEYLAPERATGRRPGPPSDLWSLGATLYTAVEGVSPFRRTSAISTMHAVVADPLRPPAAAGPLRPVIEALLVKDPDQRPDGDTAQRMLDDVLAGRPVVAPAVVAGLHHPAPTLQQPAPPPSAYPPSQGFGPPTGSTPYPAPVGRPPAQRRSGAVIGGVAAFVVVAAGVTAAIELSGDHGGHHRAAPGPSVSSPAPTGDDPTDTATRGTQVQVPASAPATLPVATVTIPTPSASASPSPAGPAAVVRAYYAAINAGDYHRAWALGGKNIEHGTFAKFKQGFAHTADDAVTVRGVTGDDVTIHLDAAQDDGTHKAFTLTYTVRQGLITAARSA